MMDSSDIQAVIGSRQQQDVVPSPVAAAGRGLMGAPQRISRHRRVSMTAEQREAAQAARRTRAILADFGDPSAEEMEDAPPPAGEVGSRLPLRAHTSAGPRSTMQQVPVLSPITSASKQGWDAFAPSSAARRSPASRAKGSASRTSESPRAARRGWQAPQSPRFGHARRLRPAAIQRARSRAHQADFAVAGVSPRRGLVQQVLGEEGGEYDQ